jgi:cyclophilin family peptidyl-prolyl cis-trans isomerase
MHKILSISFLFMLAMLFSFSQTKTIKKNVKKTPAQSPKSKSYTKDSIVNTEKRLTEIRVKITTDLGVIIVRLSDKTPKHRDNFVKLVNEHFYDSLLFHRVISNFMIQAGDPKSKNAAPGILLGSGDANYTIPAEFDSTLYHKRGALAAARGNNPQKASSGYQFYIVQGRKFNNSELDIIEVRNNIKFSDAKRMTYKINGGTPGLDMNYTVFGEVESGMEVVDEIASGQTDVNNRPIIDIKMKMEVMNEAVK